MLKIIVCHSLFIYFFTYIITGESPLIKSIRHAEKTENRNNRNSIEKNTKNTKNTKEKHENEFSSNIEIFEKSPIYTGSGTSSFNVATGSGKGNVEELVKCAVEEALDEARKQW